MNRFLFIVRLPLQGRTLNPSGGNLQWQVKVLSGRSDLIHPGFTGALFGYRIQSLLPFKRADEISDLVRNMRAHDFGVIIPMANESTTFDLFTELLREVLDRMGSATVYLIVDRISKDNTLELCQQLSQHDSRFKVVWAPENRSVVDAYLRGYEEAVIAGHQFVIEMDAGLSHDPKSIPVFLDSLESGYDCVFGSRFIDPKSIYLSTPLRSFFSRFGTQIANTLLGMSLYDATSGFQAFRTEIVKQLIEHKFVSSGHFFQTEVRFLCRRCNYCEIPIDYRNPSPNISMKSILNSLTSLLHYLNLRLRRKAPSIF